MKLQVKTQNPLQKFALREPIAFAGLMFLAQHIPLLGIFLWTILAPTLPSLTQRLILQSSLAVYAIALLTLLNWWRSAGFNSPKQWRSLNLLWFPLLFFAVYFCNNTQAINGQVLLISLVAQFITGFSEEAIYRGVILPALLPIGVMRATLLSSLLFGLSHWVRLLLGFPIESVLLTIVSATVDGVILGVLRLRTNTIWTAILVHTAGNTVGDITQLPAQTALSLSISGSVALFIYGLYLLRPSQHSQILKFNRQPDLL